MFIEVRTKGKNKKYYLVYSYRLKNKVKRITKYLGSNLNQKEIEKLRKKAEYLILEQAKEKNILEFELTEKEIKTYKEYEKELKIFHLQETDWKRFTEYFTYNTNAIEGSTVNLSEVKDLLEHKEKPHNLDEIESVNVSKAIEYTKSTKEEMSVKLIKKIHFICFKGTKSFAGKLRKVEVVIKDPKGNVVHQGAPAKDILKLLKSLCDWYKKHKTKYPPLLLSALVHNQFEHIHPFQDGNGRVGRLLLNYVLLQHKYPPINIKVKDRTKYYKSLREFDKTNNIKITLKFLINQYKKQHR